MVQRGNGLRLLNDNLYRFTGLGGRVVRDTFEEIMRQHGSECRSSSWCNFALQASGSESAKHSRGCYTGECYEVKVMEAGIIHGGGERLKGAGIFGAKFAAVNFGGGPLARLFGKVGHLLVFAGKEVSLGAKIEGQMGKRGWSR